MLLGFEKNLKGRQPKMHRLFSNETETLTLYDQQKWSLSIVSAEWGPHFMGKSI